MNADTQMEAARRLERALRAEGVTVERMARDAARPGAAKHRLATVDGAALVGAWLVKGWVVSVLPRGAVLWCGGGLTPRPQPAGPEPTPGGAD